MVFCWLLSLVKKIIKMRETVLPRLKRRGLKKKTVSRQRIFRIEN